MNSKILVTGATGTIGTFVCKYLKESNNDFVALVRTPEKAKKLNEKGFRTIIGDFEEAASLERLPNDIGKIFLLSATSPKSPELQGNLLRIAKERGIKHIVKVSARGSGVDANFNIGRFHGQTEKQIRDLGIPFTFLHPHTFMQNLLFEAQTIKEQDTIYSSMGDGKIAMIDARDIAMVAVTALTEGGHEGKTYKLTGPEPVSYHDVVHELSTILGRTIRYVQLTPETHLKEMLKSGMPVWLADDLVALNRVYAANMASEVSHDVEHVTGRKPISISRFLEDYKEHFIK
jgi:uncharacterized protein YbjT (DUF2867 family)